VRAHRGQRAAHGAAHAAPLAGDRHLPGLDLRQVEHVVHEREQLAAAVGDPLHVLALRPGHGPASPSSSSSA
jgi:hypothetical protein